MLHSVLHAGVLLSRGDNGTCFIPQAYLNSLRVQTHAGDTGLNLPPSKYFLVQTQQPGTFRSTSYQKALTSRNRWKTILLKTSCLEILTHLHLHGTVEMFPYTLTRTIHLFLKFLNYIIFGLHSSEHQHSIFRF